MYAGAPWGCLPTELMPWGLSVITASCAVTLPSRCHWFVSWASNDASTPRVFWLSKTTVSMSLTVCSAATLLRDTSKIAVFTTSLLLGRENLIPASYCSADSGAPTPLCAFSVLKFARWLSDTPIYGDIHG